MKTYARIVVDRNENIKDVSYSYCDNLSIAMKQLKCKKLDMASFSKGLRERLEVAAYGWCGEKGFKAVGHHKVKGGSVVVLKGIGGLVGVELGKDGKVKGIVRKPVFKTLIVVDKDKPDRGTANGRPVKFSQATWEWYYDDGPKEGVPEKVQNPNPIKKGLNAASGTAGGYAVPPGSVSGKRRIADDGNVVLDADTETDPEENQKRRKGMQIKTKPVAAERLVPGDIIIDSRGAHEVLRNAGEEDDVQSILTDTGTMTFRPVESVNVQTGETWTRDKGKNMKSKATVRKDADYESYAQYMRDQGITPMTFERWNTIPLQDRPGKSKNKTNGATHMKTKAPVRKGDVDDGAHETEEDETDKDFKHDDPPPDEAVEDKAEPAPHSAQVVVGLMQHKSDEDAWLDPEMAKMDHPAMKEGLQKYMEHRSEGMKMLKDLADEHHPDVDVDKMVAGTDDAPEDAGMEGEEGKSVRKDDGDGDEEKDDTGATEEIMQRYEDKPKSHRRRKAMGSGSPEDDAQTGHEDSEGVTKAAACVKDAAEYMGDLADDDSVRKVHQAGLRYHAAALHGFHKGLTADDALVENVPEDEAVESPSRNDLIEDKDVEYPTGGKVEGDEEETEGDYGKTVTINGKRYKAVGDDEEVDEFKALGDEDEDSEFKGHTEHRDPSLYSGDQRRKPKPKDPHDQYKGEPDESDRDEASEFDELKRKKGARSRLKATGAEADSGGDKEPLPRDDEEVENDPDALSKSVEEGGSEEDQEASGEHKGIEEGGDEEDAEATGEHGKSVEEGGTEEDQEETGENRKGKRKSKPVPASVAAEFASFRRAFMNAVPGAARLLNGKS
jgi:hypothetical protein